MTPDFSIIVPVYNVEPYLRACVDSILAQTFPGFELFLVDDGSPDGCGAICDEYAARDGRVTVIHQPNSGVTAARKAGLDRAVADYVCFVDSDDTVKPAWLETIRACIVENHRPDIVLFGYIHDYRHGKGEREYPPKPAPGYYDKARLEREIYPYMLWDSRKRFFKKMLMGFLWDKAYRRQLVLDHFLQDTRITQYEDQAMVYSCLYAANSLYVCHDCVYFYRYRSDSVVSRRDDQYVQNLRLTLDYMTDHLGREAPEALPQINAYILRRVYYLPKRWTDDGLSFWQTVRRFRRQMCQAKLPRALRFTQLPRRIWVFVLLVKLHLFSLAALISIRYPIYSGDF